MNCVLYRVRFCLPTAGIGSQRFCQRRLLDGYGASGLLHGQGRTATDVVWLAGDSEWTRLDEREATLHQRRQAEEILGAFTRAQLTRHYWGQFASSLIDLGLVADPSLKASVDSQSLQTRLWLTPRRGDEAYLSQVSVDGGKLRRLHCRGPIAVGTRPLTPSHRSMPCMDPMPQ